VTCTIASLQTDAAVALAPLHATCFPEEPWDAAMLARLLALVGVFGRLAWREEALAGFVLARDLGGEIEILSLGVVPDCRRQGVGRALLDAITCEAGRRGSGSIVLEVATANAPARRLYAAAGFVQVGRRPRYYRHAGQNGDALILRRAIIGAAIAQ
jgi:ribosomal-protein-alanine N-acetyltransferase